MNGKKILVICDNPGNVYVKELEKRKISFQLSDSLKRNLPAEIISPETVLLVNRGQIEGLQAKESWPQSKVLLVYGGGKKDFEPYLINIRSDLDHDYYNYGSWPEFARLVASILPDPDKHIKRLAEGKYELIRFEADYISYAHLNRRADNFTTALDCSLAYLDWLLNWLADVTSICFEQRFWYGANKKIKTLSISLSSGQMTHKGRNIFTEDSQLVFSLADGKNLEASVKKVSEEGIVVAFLSRKSAAVINSIRWFNLKSDSSIINEYRRSCLKISRARSATYPAPLSELMGERMPDRGNNYHCLTLSHTEQKILRDQSQVKALAKIFGPDYVTAVEGPPGTGKTFLTALAIEQLLKQNKTVVVTSHSNQGLDNILEQVATLLPPESVGLLFRLTNNPANISYGNKRFHRSSRYEECLPEKTEAGEAPEAEAVEKQLSSLEYQDIMIKRNNGQGVVLFVTLNSSIVDRTMKILLNSITIDFGFIDEATKGYLYEMLPLFSAVEEKLVMIGDHRQLGNISLPEEAKHEIRQNFPEEDLDSFATGFFTALVKKQLVPSHLLAINRRSLRKIADLVSRGFYGAELISGRFNPFDEGSIKFIDTKSWPDNQERKRGTSFYNVAEARIAVDQFIGRVKQCLAEGGKIQDCAIITPYQAQIREIKKRLRQALLFNSAIMVAKEDIDRLLEELVDTVDAFQGSQRYGIVLSLVRSNPYNDVGFNSDLRRLNVAISRAQDKLTIVGNSATFLGCYDPDVSAAFSDILKYIKKEGRYLELRRK
ncbi:MAG: AAA domain-containing protein [Patescibacteria group bacterium]